MNENNLFCRTCDKERKRNSQTFLLCIKKSHIVVTYAHLDYMITEEAKFIQTERNKNDWRGKFC